MVVGGSPSGLEVIANERIELLGNSERFCFHMAAELPRAGVARWLAQARAKALANARRALAPLFAQQVCACAIVAKLGDAGNLDEVLASHPRIHTAEGCFYRDVLRDACSIPVSLIAPASLDPSKLGKLAGPPWGKDQKLAALAASTLLPARATPRG